MPHPKRWKHKNKSQTDSNRSSQSNYTDDLHHGDRSAYISGNHGHSSQTNYYHYNATQGNSDTRYNERRFGREDSTGMEDRYKHGRTSEFKRDKYRTKDLLRKRHVEASTSGHSEHNHTSSESLSDVSGNSHHSGVGALSRSSQSGTIASSSNQSGCSTSSSNQPGNVPSSNSQSKVKHLPGFYYDPEKKKYFRLLPGNNNYNPLTKDGLKLKAEEETRVRMIQGKEHTQPKPTTQKSTNCNTNNMLLLQRHRGQGQLTNQQFTRYAHEQCVRMLPMKTSSELLPFPDTYFNGDAGSISFLKMDQHEDRILMVIHDSFLSRIWQGTVTRNKESGAVAIDNWNTVNVLGTRSNKITNVEWATSDRNDDLQVLYTVSGGQTSSSQLYKIYQDLNGEWKREFVFSTESMEKMCWTCAWNRNPQMQPQISIGSSRCAVIFDIATANKKELYSGHSDVLAQEYSRQRPILFNGTRRGEILGCDLRLPIYPDGIAHGNHGKPLCKFKHRVCVSSLKLLNDENYLLAGDISGKIRLWDMRMGRRVYSYEGLANKHTQLPISVDSSETLVYAAGIDKCTKFWSLKDGRLIHSIPSPLPMSSDGLPVPAYSKHWHGGAAPGLILGMERQLFWYSLAL